MTTVEEQQRGADDEPRTTGSERRTVLRLMLGSALMLFLELALIRWLGSNIVHLSYFSNFVLLGSFLGIGVGFLISRKTLVDPAVDAGAAGDPGRRGAASSRCRSTAPAATSSTSPR